MVKKIRSMQFCVFPWVLLWAMIFCITPAEAAALEEYDFAYIEEQNKQIEERNKQLKENKQKKENIIQELNTIDQDITQISNDLNQVDEELIILQQLIEQTEEHLQKKEKDLQKRTDIFHKRLKELYMDGQISYIEVLLGSTSISDFLTRLDFIKYIINQDTEMIKEITAEKNKIAQQKRELITKKEEINTLKITITANRSYLTARKKDRQAVIESLQSGKMLLLPAEGTGSHIWPTAGRVTSEYGMREHPISGKFTLHTGIDIAAAAGTPIWAADSGIVSYAGMMGGYGNTVVIYHREGLSTLYAHMASVAVSHGDKVSKGQEIGSVGSTGNSTGPHLHFEVRVNGNPVKPALAYPHG
jgi:murein DD-endopeptidase MepM/ murein hydrolase activator NlpD